MSTLSDTLVRESFLRLREVKPGGKRGLERTSALVVFLGLDALIRRTAMDTPIDLDPENFVGKNNRDALTREVVRLVHIKNVSSRPCCVLNLGSMSCNSASPEKRFSANFLTTALKNATSSNRVFSYPNRPKPILLLGLAATGLRWGIDKHPEWQENLPALLAGRTTKTPFHDLAIFILRNRKIEPTQTKDIVLSEILVSGLAEIFSEELCAYWAKRISLEKPYFSDDIASVLQDGPNTAFDDHKWAVNDATDQYGVLADRVTYLEGLLKMHHIEFDGE